MPQTFVVVVDGYGQGLLGLVLANHVVVEIAFDLGGGRQARARIGVHAGLLDLFMHDFIAQVNAFITDEYRWPCNELFHFMLAFAAKRTVKRFFARRVFLLSHSKSTFES